MANERLMTTCIAHIWVIEMQITGQASMKKHLKA